MQLFQSDRHLVADMMGAIADGKRVFVTSNSKARVRRLAAAVEHQFGADLPRREDGFRRLAHRSMEAGDREATLYRYVSPTGDLRQDGRSALGR